MAGKLNINEFVDFLTVRAAKKDGYIMGAIGQNPKKLSDWYFNQYKDNSAQYKKAQYWKEHAERVWDCQGLADGYISEKLGEKINVRARNNYASWCTTKGNGMIPENMRVPGAAVFWGDKASSISHVAFLTKPVNLSDTGGDWYMVEARGVSYGVVTTKLLARKPKYWGLMDKYFEYSVTLSSDEDYKDISPTLRVLGERVLRKGMTGADVMELQHALHTLGYDLGAFGADGDGVDGDFGNKTAGAVKAFQKGMGLDADGVYGKDTHETLMEAVKDIPQIDADDEEEDQSNISDISPDDIDYDGNRAEVIAENAILRIGAGEDYACVRVALKGEAFRVQSDDEWIPLIVAGSVLWVNASDVALG